MPKTLVYCLLLFLPLAAWSAADEKEQFSPDEIRSEFTFLYDTLRASHYDLYANRSRDDYDALHERMLAAIDTPMDRDAIQQLFQRFVAYGNVAHAKIDPPMAAWEAFRAEGGKAFPLFFRVVDGRVYIDDFMGDIDVSFGDRVLTVDGQPAIEWLEPLRAHLSADNNYLAYTLMENRLPILVWQEWGEIESFKLELEKADSRRVTVDVPALDRDGFRTGPRDRTERFQLDFNARDARMLDDALAYLRPGPFYDNRPEAEHPWDATAFKAFVDDAFERFIDQGAEKLLIDLRNNPGGNNDFSDHLVAWFADAPFRFTDKFEIRVSEAAVASNRERLAAQDDPEGTVSGRLAEAYADKSPGDIVNLPVEWVQPRGGRRFDGEVYMLINRHSYSNAVSVAAIGQDYGFATILGERTADLANTYGAMEHFTLPKTGIRIAFPKARILRPSGETDHAQVVPDIAIESPLTGASDEVLQRAVEIMAR
ncbi:MAG: S41 family peptidase [Wenzhouxiangella sp.]|jgi:C-terminal processing protease CtpA/Prc|nr:S41 family peptidase [Wenzhouxiangella sp.]